MSIDFLGKNFLFPQAKSRAFNGDREISYHKVSSGKESEKQELRDRGWFFQFAKWGESILGREREKCEMHARGRREKNRESKTVVISIQCLDVSHMISLKIRQGVFWPEIEFKNQVDNVLSLIWLCSSSVQYFKNFSSSDDSLLPYFLCFMLF